MTSRRVHLHRHAWETDGARLTAGVTAIQHQLGVSAEFPPEAAAEAKSAARNPRLPALDRTDIPFVTLDPASSLDLDQALHLEHRDEGYRVHYAIADVAAFVTPGGALEAETFKRGETLYGADSRIPLHPKVLSEDAASLLPGQQRPALLWTLDLDASGEISNAQVERARVRSTAKLSYEGLQRDFDAGTVDPMLALLKQIGQRRLELEAERGGVSLPLPEQEIEVDSAGHWQLSYRTALDVETWNAQLSLLTGMAAAKLMLAHGTGLLRTLPPADERDLQRLRRIAQGLGIAWPDGLSYPGFIRTIDPDRPEGAAVLVAAARTLRGSDYVAFHGTRPEHAGHSAIAAPYAHVTAPLRRLADRFAGEICLAACAGTPVPDWVIARLDLLPQVMRDAARRASQYESALLDLLEASVLAEHVGRTFTATVISVDDRDPARGRIMVKRPAIEARCISGHELPLGAEVAARLVTADPATRSVAFEVA
ncbi:MAG: RNB domain-containing ribonuclease [Steroidobacteraceae bacterium]